MYEYGSIGLDHNEPLSQRQIRIETAGIGDRTLGDDKSHIGDKYNLYCAPCGRHTAIGEYVTMVAWSGRKTADENSILNAAESPARGRPLTLTVPRLIRIIVTKKPLTVLGMCARCLRGVRLKIIPVRVA